MSASETPNMIAGILRRQWFLVGMLVVLVLAWGTAGMLPAAVGSWLKLGLVALIFFLSGLALHTRAMITNLGHWRLHLIIQSLSLGLIPLLGWGLDLIWASVGLDPALRLGLIVLAALPTTVTSCVVLTAAAGGNQAGAIVNATLGNLLGIILTPLWIWTISGKADSLGGAVSLWPILTKVSLVVLAPLILGQLVQPIVQQHLTRDRRRSLSSLNLGLLLGILYLAFATALSDGTSIDGSTVAIGTAIVGSLHALWLALAWYVPGMLGISASDRRCAVICISQKTLALGLPLIAIMFQGHPGLALIALPILLYHPIQLLVAAPLCSWLARGMPDHGGT